MASICLQSWVGFIKHRTLKIRDQNVVQVLMIEPLLTMLAGTVHEHLQRHLFQTFAKLGDALFAGRMVASHHRLPMRYPPSSIADQ